MNESVHTIGKNTQLVGVFTDSNFSSKQQPITLLLNSGLLGRTGPYRLHVQLARQLSKIGFRTFRLDLSGIGDSERHKDKRSHEEKHLGDIQEVMDYLSEKTGTQRFIIMGICTGAINAHNTMLADKRVLGAVCIDGYSYPTIKYHLNYYLPRIFRTSTWKNQLKQIYSRIFLNKIHKTNSLAGRSLNYKWSLPPKEKTEMDYREIIKRNTNLLCVYTSTWPYNYTNQLSDAFPSLEFGNNIQQVFLENATHTFPLLEDREILIDSISNWLKTRFSTTKTSA